MGQHFPYLHKLPLTVFGRPIWPMKIELIVLLLGITRFDWMSVTADN